MSTDLHLKNCFFDFLSKNTFSDCEFKDLRRQFTSQFPEFKSQKYYSKIYLLLRGLTSIGVVTIDRSQWTYKYTSHYTRSSTLRLQKQQEPCETKNQLYIEQERVKSNITKLYREVNIYHRYAKQFPRLSNVLESCIDQNQKNIELLECELKAIHTIQEACKLSKSESTLH